MIDYGFLIPLNKEDREAIGKITIPIAFVASGLLVGGLIGYNLGYTSGNTDARAELKHNTSSIELKVSGMTNEVKK